MNFSFGSTISNVNAVANNRSLAPWGIYDVTFEGCEITSGTSDSNEWKSLDFHFNGGDEGSYTQKFFFPNDKSYERTTSTWNNIEIPNPSQVEDMTMKLSQIMIALCPKGYEKLKSVADKLTNFDQVAEVFVKILANAKGAKTKLKLVGRNSNGQIYASIPYNITRINREGMVYTFDNFIGDNLAFTPNEKKKKAEYENHTPSPAPSTTDPILNVAAAQPNQGVAKNEDLEGLMNDLGKL